VLLSAMRHWNGHALCITQCGVLVGTKRIIGIRCAHVQGPLLVTASKGWISKYEEEAPAVPIEVGDDGLPVGIFERHKLSPRKTARTVAHQQHLDSWRLSELRNFRQQQQQREEKEAATAAGSVNAEVHIDDAQAGTSKLAAQQALQPSSKAADECQVTDVAAVTAAAADSAVQSMFSRHSMQIEKSRQRPSLHSAGGPVLRPIPQHFHATPVCVIPTSMAPVRAESEMAPRAAAGGNSHFDGNFKIEENLWSGVGGFGRNGRSKAPSSSAALQTPRCLRHKEQCAYLPICLAWSAFTSVMRDSECCASTRSWPFP